MELQEPLADAPPDSARRRRLLRVWWWSSLVHACLGILALSGSLLAGSPAWRWKHSQWDAYDVLFLGALLALAVVSLLGFHRWKDTWVPGDGQLLAVLAVALWGTRLTWRLWFLEPDGPRVPFLLRASAISWTAWVAGAFLLFLLGVTLRLVGVEEKQGKVVRGSRPPGEAGDA